MNKIITIELTGKGDTYSVVTLPLTPYELLDTLDKLRMTPQDEPDWEICQHLAHRELHDWIGDGSVYELNALCTKLAELNDQESTVFEGLVEMEKQKGEHIIPMHRLLDLAYSTGQCHLLDEVHSVEQLGRFAAENGFVPEADDLSDKAFELLDFKKLGEQFMRGEGGVIVRGGYVAQDGDLAQDVWKTLELTPRKTNYAVLVELIAPEPSDNVTLTLPATAEALTKAMTLTNARHLSETPCLCLDCRAPALRDMITDTNSLADACRAAECLASLSDAELPKYKALLAAMEIRELHEAIELSQRLDDYTLSPEQSDYEDIARGQLQFLLGKRELETLLPHVNLYQYGRALQDRHQLALTDYGSVERRDGQTVQPVERQEQVGMEMMQ
ncbi:MAG: hypothetical protein SPL18_05055 [Oscillospiraceae bacterium]|nr:hypothetical protein [Oscillospiraceae bacterium]